MYEQRSPRYLALNYLSSSRYQQAVNVIDAPALQTGGKNAGELALADAAITDLNASA